MSISPRPNWTKRKTTANPLAAVRWQCPSWFYGITRRSAERRLTRHVRAEHPMSRRVRMSRP